MAIRAPDGANNSHDKQSNALEAALTMIINNNNDRDKHLGGCLDAPAVDESQETDTAGGQHADAVEKDEEDEDDDDDNDDTECGHDK